MIAVSADSVDTKEVGTEEQKKIVWREATSHERVSELLPVVKRVTPAHAARAAPRPIARKHAPASSRATSRATPPAAI